MTVTTFFWDHQNLFGHILEEHSQCGTKDKIDAFGFTVY